MHWVIQYTTGDYIGMAVFAAIYLGVFGEIIYLMCIKKYGSKE